MDYLGDFDQDATVRITFVTSVRGVATAPSSALEAADFKIYKDGGVSQKTTTNGITVTSPFDSLTGVHLIAIDMSNDTGDAGFWVGGADFVCVLDADETLGGEPLDAVVGSWSCENRSALRPTTATRTLDVTATGAAGVDWGNVENPTTAVDLSGTDIQLCDTVTTLTGHTVQTGDSFARLGAPAGASVSADIAAVQSDTDDIQTRIPAVGPIEGTADSGSTTTMVDAARTEGDNYWDGAWILFTSGTLNGVTRLVTNFVAATDTLTFAPAAPAAVSTHTYRMIPAAQIEEVLALTGHTVQTGDSYARLGAPAGASVSADIATVDTVVDGIQTDLDNGTDGLGAIKTDTAAILVDTADMQPKLGTPAGASISADIATVDTVVDGIQTDLDNGTDGLGAIKTTADAIETDTQDIQNRLPAALVSGKMDSDATSISGDSVAADRLEAMMDGVITAAAEGVPSTTVIQTDLAETTDDHYIGRLVTFLTGNAAGEQTDITDYTGSTGTITVTALTTAPAAGDTMVIH